MTVRLTIILATLCMLAWTSPAQARMERVCPGAHPAGMELACGKANLHRATSMLRFLRMYPKAGTRHDRAILERDGKWLQKYALRHISHAQSRMLPSIPHKSGWLCIHSHEGSWTDSGDPYWGGLQMDRSFMTTYGSDMIRRFHGYANVWPAWAQMVVAERAFSSGRGYGPWPNTARYCGLL